MLISSVPNILTRMFPSLVWKVDETQKTIYLTFDDGPIPETTEWILKTLQQFNAKATFFCVGDNVRKYPELFQQILDEGHLVGNHTYNHLNGWNTSVDEYIENVEKAAKLIKSNLFRPPRGMIRIDQAQKLLEKYHIVMWNVLSVDYDKDVSPQQCLKNVTSNAKAGSIVVFHDSLKAQKNMQYALPKTLEYYAEKGYLFAKLNFSNIKESRPSRVELALAYAFSR